MSIIRVPCEGTWHEVIVGGRGHLHFPYHQLRELEAEIAMATLEGRPMEVSGCAAVLLAARGGEPREVGPYLRSFLAAWRAARQRRAEAAEKGRPRELRPIQERCFERLRRMAHEALRSCDFRLSRSAVLPVEEGIELRFSSFRVKCLSRGPHNIRSMSLGGWTSGGGFRILKAIELTITPFWLRVLRETGGLAEWEDGRKTIVLACDRRGRGIVAREVLNPYSIAPALVRLASDGGAVRVASDPIPLEEPRLEAHFVSMRRSWR